ncbi:hypothetical protein TRSC58_00732 [Trypanosoma rangeli SC58]|uniref:Uncharacterized protein n=1 Tax=Trypanosoma rangeli SC58 TaxID=429131 RepID=A0A061JBP9_TRYRA|nr:hypothetical protein TRSC58_00732 [Trypanosoma rangeli SC58]
MLANLGLESESRGGECRHHGRRHVLRDGMQDHQPTYLRAPFAVQQEPLKNLHLSEMPGVEEIFMEEENNIGSPAAACRASQPQLEAERLARGGLNIFSWNTDAPVIPPSRVRRERDVEELMRLRPLDPELKRDLEVREKFEGNTHSHFLCFSEKEENGTHLGTRRANGNPPSLVPPGPAVAPNGFSGNPGRAGAAVLHGRRRVAPSTDAGEGIAGFAGMGAGGGKRPCNSAGNDSVGF